MTIRTAVTRRTVGDSQLMGSSTRGNIIRLSALRSQYHVTSSSSSHVARISNTSRVARHNKSVLQQRRWQSTGPNDQAEAGKDQPGPNTQLANTLRNSDQSDLVTEVNIASDPHGILPPDHPAMAILGNSSVVIQRQIEWLGVFLPVEQANKYIIMDGKGDTIGYLAEQDHGVGQAMKRQMAQVHRSFTAHVFDKDQREVLRIHRPFTYINSRVSIYDPVPRGGYSNDGSTAQISPLTHDNMPVIGECQQTWAATERKYTLSTYRSSPTSTFNSSEAGQLDKNDKASMNQFAKINERMLSWDFNIRDDEGQVIGGVNRSFRGFAREAFTDSGLYALRMDAAVVEDTQHKSLGLTLDQRAVMIATAVSIDFDYFSRNSSTLSTLGYAPLFWPMGGAAAEGGAVAGAGAGVAEGAGAVAGTAGRGIAGAGVMESGIAGAGTMAGYEAMQRGFGREGSVDDASPTTLESSDISDPSFRGPDGQPSAGQEDVWGSEDDPWKEAQSGTGDGASGSAEGEGGIISSILEWFTD